MDEKRDRYGMGGNPPIAPGGNGYGSGSFNGNGGRGYNGHAPPYLGLDGGESSISGRGPNDERYGSRPPNTPMTPYTPYTPKTVGYDGGESSISAATPRHDRYYGEESAIGGRPAVTPGTAPYRGGEGSFNVSTPRTGRYDGRESYIEARTPKAGRHEAAESIMSAGTPRTGRFDPGMESSIAHPDTPRTAHYDTTATTMSIDQSRTGPYDKDNTITVAEYYDPERAREHERQMMERERFERERGIARPSGTEHSRPPTEYLSTSGSSTSSYLDISRHFPTKGFSIRSFFTTPSEKSDSKRKKKKSKKLTRHNSSSSSSLNEDLAFGTGFLRYRRKRNVRSRDGRDRQWETVGYKSSKENLREGRSITNERPTSARRPTTDAEILAVGAGLAKLARDQHKKDTKNGKNGRAVPETSISSNRRHKRGNPSSRTIPNKTDPNDDEAWESASDDESDSSVDTGLAFGGGGHAGKNQAGKSKAGFFGRRRTHGPKSRKSCVVDPRLLGPQNSLNGYLSDRAVGFEDVQWESGSDFGQHTYTPYDHPDRHVTDVYVYERERVSRTQSAGSGSQAPLQQVFPVPTDDPSRFDVARASSSEQNTPRPAPVPIQQPQPITPVSQSVYYESKYVRSESGGILKSSPARSKSLAGAALAGVAGAAVGAVIASNLRDEKESPRDDDRRDQRSYSESAISRRDDNRKERRRDDDQYSIADSSIFKPRDDDRKERRRDYDLTSVAESNLTWDEKRERRREERRKDDSRSSTSSSDRDKNRERIRDDPDAAAEERERRRRERREERRAPDRIEDNYEERRSHVLSEISAIARTPTDPFQYQVSDSPPHEESSSRPREESVPSVVTVEREPDFTVKRSSSFKESYSISRSVSRSESRSDFSDKNDKEQRHKDELKALRDAEKIYEEAEHSTAPIEAAAIAAAAAAIVKDGFRESRSAKRRGERRSDSEDPPKDSDSNNAPEKSHEDVMAEADRAYREIVMARKVAAEVRRSRTPSPERSVINKYEEELEEEPPRIVTPPGMHERRKGPYDAPNADFKLDYIMTPKDLKVYSIPGKRYKVDEADLMGPFMTKDPDARLPRPLLNLIRPTPTSTPSPEKQFAASARKENENTTDSNQSSDRSTERSRSEPESERYSKLRDRDEEREQTSARPQDESTHFNDRNQDPEQTSSYRSQDEPAQTRDEDQSYEETPLYQSQDEQMDATQAHEQTPSHRSEDILHDTDNRKRSTRDIPPPIIIGPRGDLIRSSDVSAPSPTQSTVSKAVTWGPNETKHFEVESPTEPRDEFISDSSPETPENPRYSEPRSESRSEPKGRWAEMAAGILGAGLGAVGAGSSESSKRSEVSELPRSEKLKDVEQDERSYEYRGVVVEPESPYGESRPDSPPRIIRRDSMPRDAVVELGREILARESRRNTPPQDIRTENLPQATRRDSPPQEVVFELGRQILARESRRNSSPQDNRSEGLPQVTRRDSAPNVGPKPSPLQSSHMPGSFADDLEFSAVVAAGLEDTGFDPNLVYDTEFRKRDSPHGSNEYTYKSPWAESIDDISSIPGEDSSNGGFVMGEVPETPKDWTSVSPADDESSRASKKEQKKRNRERRRSGGDVSSPITDIIVEEPESYFDSSRESRKEQKKRDKGEARRQSLLREESSFVDISPTGELVEEPESYVEPIDTPKKLRKSSRSSTYDGDDIDSPVSTPKRNFSKRSLTYDDKAEPPLRESRRTHSLDDIKNGDEFRTPRKSKRDGGQFDSPSNSGPPSEAGSDSETSSRKKSKERSLSRDLDLSKEPERPSRRDGDDPLWASSRSILSAGSSSKQDDEDPTKKNRKDRSSTKEDNDGTKSIALEPTRDEIEAPKKKAKETPKKSGGLFGFFSGTKSDAAKEELVKGTRDEFDEAKKKKKKRSSTSDGITGSQPSSHLSQLGSSETNGHKSRNEDGTRDSRNDLEGKRSKSSDSKDSFLDNAGILGAGAGLAAGAIAISAQHQQQNAANNNDSEGTMGETGETGDQEKEEILDPEIIERQINPSIDPQYGDLLPLPPSGPVSPNFDPIDDLPKLPESRPATPESKKRTVGTPRDKTPQNRKSLQETLVKSPSQSAVPLKFVMGNRSNPESPVLTRSIGNTPFPAFQASPIAESTIVPRSRSRPMSWDNTKEFKPLYLLETNNRRGSFVSEELIDPLPHLPPSRTNSELDVADLPELGILEKPDLHRPSLDPLLPSLPSDDLASGESTPTAITFKRNLAPSVEFLQDSFPSLEEKENLNLSTDVHSHESFSSDSLAEAVGVAATATAAGFAIETDDTINEKKSRTIQEIQDKSEIHNLEYAPGSHDIVAEQEKTSHTLTGTSNEQTMSIEGELESTEEFPLSKPEKTKKGEGLALASNDITDQAENTPEQIQELEPISTPTKAEHVEPVDEVSTPEVSTPKSKKKKKGKKGKTTSLEQEHQLDLQTEISSQEDKQEPKPDNVSSEHQTVTESSRNLFEKVARPIEFEPTQPYTPKLENDKNDKPGKSDPSFVANLKAESADNAEPFQPMDESPLVDKSMEQEQVPGSSQEIVEAPLPSVEIDPVEEFSVSKSRKEKKKDEKKAKAAASQLENLVLEPISVSATEMPIQERPLEELSEFPREISDPQSSSLVNPEVKPVHKSPILEISDDITPTVDEFTSPKSTTDNEIKKVETTSLDPEPKQAVIEPNFDEPIVSLPEEIMRDTSSDISDIPDQETLQEPTTLVNVEKFEESSSTKSKNDKKNDKEKTKEQTMDLDQEPVGVSQEKTMQAQEKDLVEAPILEEKPKLADIIEGITSPFFRNKKGKATDIEKHVESSNATPMPKSVSERPTPLVGPGGWPITPATPWTAGAEEASKPNDKEYFPAAEDIFPAVIAGAAVLGAEQPKSDETPQDKNELDDLAAGYGNDKLRLPKQLDGESAAYNERLRKDKKYQGQTETPERSLSRSRSIESSNLEQPRSRSATMVPSAASEREELNRMHINETPEPASQLQEEFNGSSSIDSDKEKRSSGLSKLTTREEPPNESFVPQDVTDSVPQDLSEDFTTRDGLSAGHSEEQLSLARQLTAEFGGKSEKDQNHQIAPQIPQEERGQLFDDAEKSPATEPQNEEKSIPVKNEALDGLDAGDKEDQLEPAEESKEEFKSSNSKDKTMENPISQDQNDEFPSNSITSDSAATDMNDQADVPTSQPEIVEGPQTIIEDAHVDNVTSEQTPLEETPAITQEPETSQNVPTNPIFTEPEVIKKEPVDQITTEPVLDNLLTSNSSGYVVTPDILDKPKTTDTPEPLGPEYLQIINEPHTVVDPETEFGPTDKKEDGAIEPTSIEDTSLPEDIDSVNSSQDKYEEAKHVNIQQEIPATPSVASTVDRKIEFSSPPKKSQKDRGKQDDQAQDLIEDAIAAKEITSASQSTNIESLVEQPDSAPVEQIITMPANESSLNDALSTPMTAGLSGLMGPLTGRKKGVLEMVQALGWGKKKDKAAIAAAEQGLPPRPSTARPSTESSMTSARAVSESSVPKVIEVDPIVAPTSNEELEKWALPDKMPRKNSKGKNITNADHEPVQDTIIEETLPIEPKEDIAQQVVELPASIPILEVQSDMSPKRQKGKKRHSLQSFVSEEASKAFRARESASKEPETSSLTTEPAFIEHSSEVTPEPTLENPVEENKEHEPESVLDASAKEPKKDKEKRQSLQSAVSEDTPMEEPNVPRENDVFEESKSQTSENDKPIVENSNEPLEIQREYVLEDVQTPPASVGHNSEPVDEGHGESGKFHGETVKEEIFAPQPQPEHIYLSAPIVDPITEKSSEPEEVPREVIQKVISTPQPQPEQIHEPVVEQPREYSNAPREIIEEALLERSPEPIEQRFNEPLEISPEVVQEDDFVPQAPIEDVSVSTTILNKASLPNEPVSEETTKTIEDIEPIMVDESNLPEDIVPEDIMASVEYVEPESSLQETHLPRDSLLERSDKNIEVAKPNTVDDIPLQEDATPEEDPRKAEFDEPSQSSEESLLPREVALEETSKDFDHSLPEETVIQDESKNAEISGPSHVLEESSLSTEPPTNIEKAEPLSSELPVIEASDARDASTTKKTKDSRKNKKSKDKSQPEPATSTDIIQEPEQTLIAQEPVSEKPFEITESNNPKILEVPIEKGIEMVEPESYHFLDPTSVPLPEDLDNESIELDESANAEILEKPLEHSTSTRIPEKTIANPEIEKPEILEVLDDFEYAASIPLPEDDIKTSTEYNYPESHEVTKVPELVLGNMEQATENLSNLEVPSKREPSEFSEPVPPTMQKSTQEPAPVSPKRLRKDKKKRKSVMTVPLAKESPLPESISKIDTRAVEPISEEVPQIPAAPVVGPSEETIANEPQVGEDTPKEFELETEQKAIEPTELATTPRNIEAVEHISQDNFSEPIGRVSPKQSKKDEKRKSRLSMPSAEENTTRAPLQPSAAQQAEDKPSQASIQNPTESVLEANSKSIVDPTPITLEAEQDDAPESISQDSLDKQSIETSVKDITDSQESNLADPAIKKSTNDEKKRESAITPPSDDIPTESQPEMTEPSKSIDQPPTEGIPGDILPEEFTREVAPEPVALQEPLFEPEEEKDEITVSPEPTIEPIKSEPQKSISQEPIIAPDHAKEEYFAPQKSRMESQIPVEPTTYAQKPALESEIAKEDAFSPQDTKVESAINEEQFLSREPISEPDIIKEEALVPEESTIESTSQPQISTSQNPFLESEITKEESFVPQESAFESQMPDEEATFQQEPDTTPNFSDSRNILAHDLMTGPTTNGEQLPIQNSISEVDIPKPEEVALPDSPVIEASIRKPEQIALPDSPIIEASIPKPEQVALPDSPIEPKSFEPEVSFPQEFALLPEAIENAPIFQERKIDSKSLDLKLAIPQKFPLEPKIVELEPEQISLPESPVEQEILELEIPFQQEPVSEPHVVEELTFPRERPIDTERSGFGSLAPIEFLFEHKLAEPGQIALPESPIEQQESEPEVSFQQEPVVESKKSLTDITLPDNEPNKTVKPDQIALPDSPVEEKEFEPEVFFQQEPVVDTIQHPINVPLPGQKPSAPQHLPLEKKAAETELLIPQTPFDLKMTQEVPTFHGQNTNSKPVEQKITRPRKLNAKDPILESRIKGDAAFPQERSTEPNMFESEKTGLDAVHEGTNDVELEKSRKDKEKRKENLDLSETPNEPADVTSTSQESDIQTPTIVSRPISFNPITDLTPNSQPIGFEHFHPGVESITSDPVDSTHRAEPTIYENASNVTLKAEPTPDQPSIESLPVKTDPETENELAWPAEESKEDERKGENVSALITESPRVVPRAEQFEDSSLEITEPQSMEVDIQHPQNVTEEPDEEPDEELFFEAVESLPTEKFSAYTNTQVTQAPVQITDPDSENIPQEPTEQSIEDILKPLLDEESPMSPIPETVQQKTEDVVPDFQDIRLNKSKAIPVGELPTVDLPRESLIEEHPKEGYGPVEDDVTEVLTENSKDINDRAPDIVEPVPAEIILDDFKAMPIREMPKEVQQQTEDEWGSVSIEESKKDKKRNSILSAPLEPEVLSVATELPKDISSNSGRAEELTPTIDNDVLDTHTSFQVQQFETIVRGDDLFGMSHDKKGEELSSGKFHSDSQPPTGPNTVAVSETQHIEPGGQLLTSPLPIRNIVQTSESTTKPEPILSTTSSSSRPSNNEANSLPSALSLMGPKKDKRKRQATISLNTPNDDQSVFWAGEIPEAEVIRAVPVIEDIGRDEFYSHIARAVEGPRINEYSRPPAKKVKKNTRRQLSNIGNFRPPIKTDLPHNEPMRERKEMPSVIATTAAIANTAFLANKSKESELFKKNESLPKERYLEKEEERQIINEEKPSNDKFDDSVQREDKYPKVFEETKYVSEEDRSDGHDRDEFQKENMIVREPEQVENTQESSANEMSNKYEPPTPRIPALDRAQLFKEPEQMQNALESTIEVPKQPETTEAQENLTLAPFSRILDNAEFVQEPEQTETAQDEVIAETLAEPGPVERSITHEPEQMEIPQEPMVQIPAKPLIMEAREIRTPTRQNFISDDNKHLEIEKIPVSKHYASSSSLSPRSSPPAREPRGDLSEDYLSRPSRREMGKKKKKKDEFDNIKDLLPAPIQEALRSIIVQPRSRSISPSPVSSPTAERAKRARSRSRPPSRPGTPGLTMLPEESEEEHTSILDNRDSAFVNDSPIPPQGNLTENHEDIRESGIHVRENSPSMHVRAPVSSADAAIESMAWPSVDEDAGTVDLKKLQRPKVVESLEHHDHRIDDLPTQKNRGERHTDLHKVQTIHGVHSPREEKHKLTRKTSLTRGELAEANHVDFVRSQRLKAFQTKSKEKLSESNQAEPINKSVTPEKQHTRHRVHRSELTDPPYRKPKDNKYGELEPSKTPRTPKAEQRSVSESSPSLFGSAALAAAGLGFAAARKSSQESRPLSAQSHKRQRSASNISVTRLRTPVPLDAPQPPQFPDNANTNRSFTPPLRRTSRKISGDLKSLRQQSSIDLAKEIVPASVITATSTSSINTANPTANEGRARAQEMADVYDGYGEGRIGSPRSPTRPHSMRRRQSMQVLELESKLDQLTAENRALAESKAHAEHMLRSSQGAPAALVERDAQIDLLKRTLASMQDEVKRLTEVNAGLSSAAVTLGQQYNARYGTLESQHAQTSRELQQAREAHHNLQIEVEGIIHNAIQERDHEIASLRSQLGAAKEQIRAMQKEILAAKAGDAQFLIMRDEDYFDTACQQLCQHVQQWVLRFSKFSDMRACRLTSEINNDKTIDRLDNAILDGSDVDSYLADRVRRRDVFMSMTMTMLWEFIFTRYLFGMDREQRQKLKSLEKVLSEVGPPSAVHQWRATTLTLLSKRDSFARQKEQDTLAVVHAVFETLTEILPPPSHLEGQIEEQLKRVVKAAVDLSIEMRTQRAEYMMLPPLQPEYDANGDLASKVSFNAALMNERSGDTISNEELEAQKAVVRVVLFPLVVKKGDDFGQGDEEIVVCPAQVLVAKPRMGRGPVGRIYSPANGVDMDRRSDMSRTPTSIQSSMPDTNVI
ncbi:hypothetical protein EYC80_005736 [Monilinia laxa]|uniref:Involucrin repeat protein n=1 Tax=Monilinia laxa TaxID=61186 RepID=A0A5N6KEU0_MONLA|nr:hypothetical protein EYC80_005736 [Monilinia laxa]